MKIYIGNYWVPFPSSEYGGTWVVIAKDKWDCINFLKNEDWRLDYHHKIEDAVDRANVYDLSDDYSQSDAGVVSKFFT